MRICGQCGGQISTNSVVMHDCRARSAVVWSQPASGFASAADIASMDQRRAIEAAVFNATAPLHDEIARLRAEIRRLQAEATVPGGAS